VCQRSSNHKLKAIHNQWQSNVILHYGVSKIVKSQIESNSQQSTASEMFRYWCVKDRQITNWKQFTTNVRCIACSIRCVKDRQITNWKQFTTGNRLIKKDHPGVSKIVKSQIESNSQQRESLSEYLKWCVKDRQITNWKQFTTLYNNRRWCRSVCQRSSNHKLKAIHNNCA